MSSITDTQDAMGEVYKAWLAKSSDEATENQARFVECRDAAIGGGWSPCNFKWAKNEWPSRCGLPINAVMTGPQAPKSMNLLDSEPNNGGLKWNEK